MCVKNHDAVLVCFSMLQQHIYFAVLALIMINDSLIKLNKNSIDLLNIIHLQSEYVLCVCVRCS